MTDELLLTWLSERGSGSWRAFRKVHDWLFSGSSRVAVRSIRTLSLLGHVEMDWQASRWAVAPPALAMLPAAGGHAVLVGSRTRELMRGLTERTSDEVTMELLCHQRTQEESPNAVFLASRNERDVEQLAVDLGISYEGLAALKIADLFPDMDSVLAQHGGTESARGFEMFRFEPKTLGWRAVATDQTPGVYRYSVHGKRIYRLRRSPQEVLSPPAAWAIFAELYRTATHVLEYREESVNGGLVVPGITPLPDIHARAAALCSGTVPAKNLRANRLYLTYRNVPRSVAEAIARSLNQPLIVRAYQPPEKPIRRRRRGPGYLKLAPPVQERGTTQPGVRRPRRKK